MVAQYEAGPTEDSIAREMARLTFDKVTAIAEVQHIHSRRLAGIESKLDDHSATLKEHGVILKEHSTMLKEHSVRLASIESKVDDHSAALKEHGVMLRQILARLPKPPAA